ncbi:oligosaccharide flippase family protein [Arthrobacter sp. SAFR-179]|uniref:oligosaccharide flippase family protein n=1 Tax=Arthrobacter sp. SAFR-179 TaxID=3387279 RepID=UPI003F7CCBBA
MQTEGGWGGRRKRAGDFLWALAGRGGAAALQALTLVLLARFSNPADFGLTMGVQGVLLTAAYFLGFGLGPYVIVEQAKARYSEVVGGITYVNNRTSAFSGIACFVGLVIAGIFNSEIFMLLPLAVAMLAMRNSAVIEGIALANGRVRIFGASLLLRRLAQALIFVILSIAGMHAMIAYSIAYAASESLINFFLRKVIGSPTVPATKPKFNQVIRSALPYWVETVAVQFRGLDVSSVGLAAGAAVGGIYAVPARLSSAILMIPSTFANLILPKIAAGNRKVFLRVAGLSLPVILIVWSVLAGLVIYTEPILAVLLGPTYVSASAPVQIFCIGFAVLTCITIVNAMVQGIGLAQHVAWTSMVGSVLAVVCAGLGASLLGAQGASWGFSLGVSIQLVLLCASSARGVMKYLTRK